MPKGYIPSTGGHKRGPQPKIHEIQVGQMAERCGCGKNAIVDNGGCLKCGRRVPGHGPGD